MGCVEDRVPLQSLPCRSTAVTKRKEKSEGSQDVCVLEIQTSERWYLLAVKGSRDNFLG